MFGLGLSGQPAEGIEIAEAMLADVDASPMVRLGALLGRGVLQLWSGDPVAATTDLAAAVSASRDYGPFHVGIVAQIYLADAQFRAGHWASSSAQAEAAIAAATDAGQLWFAPLMHAVAAFPLAGRGCWEEATYHVEAATQGAVAVGHLAGRIWAATAAAQLAHAQGDHARVLEVLDPIADEVDAAGVAEVRNPGIQPWAILHAEARIRVRLDGSALDRLDAGWVQPAARLELARLRGLSAATTGDQEAAHSALATPVSPTDLRSAPLSCALLGLEYGALLRRLGRRRDARVQLTTAYAQLEVLGARPYLDQCDQQLRACGGARMRTGPSVSRSDSLTAQERIVAELVAEGASNREAADRLFVSVKTIEYHLGNIYRKLDIRSRSQLASRLGPSGPPAETRAPASR